MPTQVHIHPKVERQLERFEKMTKARSIAAGRARRIIDALIQGQCPAGAGLLKRKTDKRVKNCLKFDLGSGFRLICVNPGKIIYVLFVGDHDSADNWLNNCSRTPPHKTELEMHTYIVGRPSAQMSGTPEPMEDGFEGLLSSRITQEDLRLVFKGLVG